MAYNEAVADSSNQLLLRNIVRASERRPTYYTRLEGDTAAASISPTLGVAFPFNKGSSFERDTTGGVLTGTKSVATLAALTSTIGATAPETNTMTLQTLDDQKYQIGMMKPLDFTQLKSYFDEGFSRDLLLLMFIPRITVKPTLIEPIDAAIGEKCAEPDPGDVCRYIATDPYSVNFSGGSPKDHWSLEACSKKRGAVHVVADGGIEFDNDPAQEILPPGGAYDPAAQPHPQMCFEILLQDLIALGLDITPGGTISAEIVDANLPANLATDPGFRIEMMKEKASIVMVDGEKRAVICSSKPDSVAFTLTFAHAPEATTASLSTLAKTLSSDLRAAINQSGAAAGSEICSRTGQSAVTRARPAHTQHSKNANPEDDGSITTIRLLKKDIMFAQRSFEGMIYYLGEVVRAEQAGVDANTIVRVRGRKPAITGAGYTESLFYASSKLDSKDAILSVRNDDGNRVYLAKSCPSSVHIATPKAGGEGCSDEFPDTESIAVISLLNQIWGHQKEATAPLAAPVVLANP